MATGDRPFGNPLDLPADPRLALPLPLSVAESQAAGGQAAVTLGPRLLTGGAAAPRFPANSRYQGIPAAVVVLPDGRAVAYLRRRFVPRPEDLAPIGAIVVTAGDRLDNLTAAALSDPELFWRICDANRAMDPPELEEPGRRLIVAAPEGFPATTGGVDDLGAGGGLR